MAGRWHGGGRLEQGGRVTNGTRRSKGRAAHLQVLAGGHAVCLKEALDDGREAGGDDQHRDAQLGSTREQRDGARPRAHRLCRGAEERRGLEQLPSERRRQHLTRLGEQQLVPSLPPQVALVRSWPGSGLGPQFSAAQDYLVCSA